MPSLKKILKRLHRIYGSCRCLYTLCSRSLVITVASYLPIKNHRQLVNQLTQVGAQKILRTAKAKYKASYLSPLFDLNKSYIFMSNHQSLMDLPLIYATLKGNIRPVTKIELYKTPFFGQALKKSECVPVNRHDPSKRQEFIQQAKEKIASGISLWFFPESTRSSTGELLPFKRGGFILAKEMDTPIVPVGIVNTRAILPARDFCLAYGQEVALRVGEPIDVREYDNQDGLIGKVRGEIMKLVFGKD